jgi:hypothetical protein
MKPSMMPQKSQILLSPKTNIIPSPLIGKTIIDEPLGEYSVKNATTEVVWGKKRTVNGYKRNFTPHALHRMKERGISRTDIKNATHNIRTMSPISDGRWMLVSKDGLVIIGLLEENPECKYFVILTAYRPQPVE